MVARTAREWTRETSIFFDFGREPDFNSCGGKEPFDVRVGFEAKGSWSYIGRDAANVPQDQPTVNLQGIGEKFDAGARRQVLHEFGHVLGLLHEEQNPQAGCREELDLDKLRGRGFSQQAVDSLLATVGSERVVYSTTEMKQTQQRTVPNNGEYISTGFDQRSVMRMLSAEFFKSGEKSKCSGPFLDALSEDDLKMAKLLYPRKPADVSASEGNYLTIRLSGVLAPEHYGHVLAALYEKDKLELKKHVLLENSTIEKVVQGEKLTPRGVTALATEEFLCQINPHVCRKVHGRSRWYNTAATRNYAAGSDLSCPNKALPKFILCVPNVRIEPYTVLYNFQFELAAQLVARPRRQPVRRMRQLGRQVPRAHPVDERAIRCPVHHRPGPRTGEVLRAASPAGQGLPCRHQIRQRGRPSGDRGGRQFRHREAGQGASNPQGQGAHSHHLPGRGCARTRDAGGNAAPARGRMRSSRKRSGAGASSRTPTRAGSTPASGIWPWIRTIACSRAWCS